jgi:hypothetical protein
MSISHRLRRPAATVAAAALVLPLAVAAVVPAAATAVLVDRTWPPYPGSADEPFAMDTTEATAAQPAGLATYRQLQRAVTAHDPGDSVVVTWTDPSDSSHSATVALGRAPVA